MPTYEVTIGEQVVRVRLRRDAERVFVAVDDGEEQVCDLRPVHGALQVLQMGEARLEVMAARTDDEVRLALGGGEYAARVVDEAHARLASVAGGRAATHAHAELRAPMPGLLVRLLCGVGDTVVPGAPLAVLQAMKMENELSLPRGGTVTRVNVATGQTVEQGQVLVVVE